MDALVMEAKAGNKRAMEQVCKMHEGAVHTLANRFKKAVPFKDGVQYGYLGLLRAVRDYDGTREEKFITYAWYKIFGAIQCSFKRRQHFITVGSFAEAVSYDDCDSIDNEIDLSMLTERERTVLERAFLYGEGSRVIGKAIGLSHEWVLNIKREAIQKLREYYGSDLL